MKGDDIGESSLRENEKRDDLEDERSNLFKGTSLEKWWGTATLLGFTEMRTWEKFCLRIVIVVCALYIFFLDDIIWFTFFKCKC